MAIPCLAKIESNGIYVDPELITTQHGSRVKRFIDKNQLVYSEYNLYTTAGRCSNRFGNINFAAMNKKDGTRKAYTSRFENGMLVSADFESFHLRLIADIIGYEFPVNEPIHEYLGKQYFETDSLSQEQYDEGKTITFALLYGDSKNTDVPEFFRKVYEYVDVISTDMKTKGYITSPYSNRKIYKDRIENFSPAKLFNYMIQLAETERNLKVILEMSKIFQFTQSKPVMYTYDSILFDYTPDDGPEPLKAAIEVLTEHNKYPMRVYYGKNYHDITSKLCL